MGTQNLQAVLDGIDLIDSKLYALSKVLLDVVLGRTVSVLEKDDGSTELDLSTYQVEFLKRKTQHYGEFKSKAAETTPEIASGLVTSLPEYEDVEYGGKA